MELYSNWKDTLFQMDMQPLQSMDEVAEQSYSTKTNDIGLIHPINGAGILVRENKKIEAYSDFGLGFRMDPDTQSFSVFAPTIKFFTNEFKTYDYEEDKTYFEGEYQDIINILEGNG